MLRSNAALGVELIKVGYIFNHEFFLGGGEISLLDLVLEVRRYDVVPVVFVPAKGEIADKLDVAGIRYVVCPWSHLNLWSIPSFFHRVEAVTELFSDEKLDLVHVNGARSMLYAGSAARRAGIPCVWHVRVLERDGIIDRIRAYYATAIIANSKAVSKSLKTVIGANKRVDVIYNGFDLEAAGKAMPLDLKKAFGLPDLPVVLCVGRFTREKAFEDAIMACSLLQKRGIEVSLLLVGGSSIGDSEYEQELKNLVVSQGLHNVVFTGWRSDIHSIMKSCSVFVLSSHRESFGRVIVESWACGLPIVSTNCGGPTELVKDGVDGFLVPIGNVDAIANAFQRLICDLHYASMLSNAGLERSRYFSISGRAADVVVVYRRLLALL